MYLTVIIDPQVERGVCGLLPDAFYFSTVFEEFFNGSSPNIFLLASSFIYSLAHSVFHLKDESLKKNLLDPTEKLAELKCSLLPAEAPSLTGYAADSQNQIVYWDI